MDAGLHFFGRRVPGRWMLGSGAVVLTSGRASGLRLRGDVDRSAEPARDEPRAQNPDR